MIKVDLHIHSTYSDGSALLSEKIIQIALENNVNIIAFTNYDIVTKVEEIYDDIKIITAGEFYCKNHDEIKILAYDFKKQYEVFNNYSATLKKARLHFFYNSFKLLNADEISFFKTDFYNFIKTTENIKVLSYFKTYRETYWNEMQLISQIHSCGGLAVLSCPSYIYDINNRTEEIVKHFISLGIDGIECYHPNISPLLQEKLIKICTSHNLLISGGSNFSKRGGEIGKIENFSLSSDLLTICNKFKN